MNTPVVLITGALAGIGRATALAFGRAKARIILSGRNAEAGGSLAAELTEMGAQAEFIKADVRSDADLRRLVDATVAKFGRLDIAVNAAGTEGKPGAIVDQSSESYAAVFDTNVLGTLLSMKHELRVMQEQKSGIIVNFSSTFGHVGAAGASLYSASKHAVEGLTRSAALEVAGRGIRINAIAPGPVDTGMLDRFAGGDAGKQRLASAVPIKRIGQPEEIANAVLFVASSGASFVTGHILRVDGGKSAA